MPGKKVPKLPRYSEEEKEIMDRAPPIEDFVVRPDLPVVTRKASERPDVKAAAEDLAHDIVAKVVPSGLADLVGYVESSSRFATLRQHASLIARMARKIARERRDAGEVVVIEPGPDNPAPDDESADLEAADMKTSSKEDRIAWAVEVLWPYFRTAREHGEEPLTYDDMYLILEAKQAGRMGVTSLTFQTGYGRPIRKRLEALYESGHSPPESEDEDALDGHGGDDRPVRPAGVVGVAGREVVDDVPEKSVHREDPDPPEKEEPEPMLAEDQEPEDGFEADEPDAGPETPQEDEIELRIRTALFDFTARRTGPRDADLYHLDVDGTVPGEIVRLLLDELIGVQLELMTADRDT